MLAGGRGKPKTNEFTAGPNKAVSWPGVPGSQTV